MRDLPTAREIDIEDVGAVTARERPGVALVGLGKSSAPALDMIDTIVREAACPVIVLLHARDPAFVGEASKRGSVRPHQRRRSRGLAERDRHRASPSTGTRGRLRPAR